MTKIYYVLILLCVVACNTATKKSKNPESAQNAQLGWLQTWFSAWELTSKDLLSLPEDTIPDMLFFDEKNIYTTSAISAPAGTAIEGPKMFGKELPWRMAPHNGKIMLPNEQEVPVGLMSFAAPGKNKVFFIMAAPSYWKTAGVDSKELGLDNLLTGVFLHEFAHTRQFNGFGKQIDSIEKNYSYKEIELTDDIVQDHFKKDSVYTKLFRAETAKFYEAARASTKEDARKLTREGLLMGVSRKSKYFVKEKALLNRLDDIYLSMEGVGQFVAVAWLIDPKGGNISFDTAVNGFRRGRNQWSQEQGLAMFLALRKLTTTDWTNDMFGSSPKTIVELLEKATQNEAN